MTDLINLLRELEQRPDRFTQTERKRILIAAIHTIAESDKQEAVVLAWANPGALQDVQSYGHAETVLYKYKDPAFYIPLIQAPK